MRIVYEIDGKCLFLKVWQARVTDSALGLFYNDIQNIDELVRVCFAQSCDDPCPCLKSEQVHVLTAVFTHYINEYAHRQPDADDDAVHDQLRESLIKQFDMMSRCDTLSNYKAAMCREYASSHADYIDVLTLDGVSDHKELCCCSVLLSLMIRWENLQRHNPDAHDYDYIFALYNLYCRYPKNGFLFYLQLYTACMRKDVQLLSSLNNQILIMREMVSQLQNNNPQCSPSYCFDKFRSNSINIKKLNDVFISSRDPYYEIMDFSFFPILREKWDSEGAKEILGERFKNYEFHFNKVNDLIKKTIDNHNASNIDEINKSAKELQEYLCGHPDQYREFEDLGDDLDWFS